MFRKLFATYDRHHKQRGQRLEKKKHEKIKINGVTKGQLFSQHNYYCMLPKQISLFQNVIFGILIKPKHVQLDLCILYFLKN